MAINRRAESEGEARGQGRFTLPSIPGNRAVTINILPDWLKVMGVPYRSVHA